MAGAASSPLQGYLFLEAFCAHASAQISARDQSLASQQELSTLLAHAINLQVLSMVLPPALPHTASGAGSGYCNILSLGDALQWVLVHQFSWCCLLLGSCWKFGLRAGTCLSLWSLNVAFPPRQC